MAIPYSLTSNPSTEDSFYLHCFDGKTEIELSSMSLRKARVEHGGIKIHGVRKIVITCEVGSIPTIEIVKLAGLTDT